MTAAALGTTVDLPTLEADVSHEANTEVERTVALEIKPGTQSGEQLVLRARGVPRLHGTGRGDVVVTVIVETPTRLDQEQIVLLESLAKMREETGGIAQVGERHKSVFDRFKDALGGR